MSKLRKKIFVSAIAAFMVAGVAVAPVAQAQTVAELQAQIAALLANINALQSQIAALGGSTGGGIGAGIPAGFTFTRSLSQGSTGSDVLYLQKLLNTDQVVIANSGAGSPGQETQYYGSLTAAGVTRFQNKYASEILTPLGLAAGTGFFGPSTIAKANALLAGGTFTPSPTPTPTPGITTPGAEGSVIVTVNSNPASGLSFNVSESKAVGAVDVQVNGSDVLLNRLDLTFDHRPWLYLSEITVSDGTTTKTVAVTEAASTEVTVGSSYLFRINDLNILAQKDTTKTITVTVKALSGLPGTDTTEAIVLTFGANAVRGTDGAGLSQTAPTAALSTRTFTINSASTATLELTTAASSPDEQAVIVNSTAETTGVTLAIIEVKAKNNAAILRTVEFRDTDDASGTINVAYLYDGSTLLSSTSSLGAATSTFSNVDLSIAKDTTKTLTIKADINKTTGNFEDGASSTVKVEANATGLAAEDGSTFATATVSGSTATAKTQHYYTKAPKITVSGQSISGVESGTASSSPLALNGAYTLNVTAQGGDIYIPISSSNSAASSGILVATSTSIGPTAALTATYTSNADFGDSSNDTYVVRSGETKAFNVSGNITACSTADTGAFVGLVTTNIKWGTTVAAAQQPANTWTWDLTDFKSGELFLPACT